MPDWVLWLVGAAVLAAGEDGVLRWWNGADAASVVTFPPPAVAPK